MKNPFVFGKIVDHSNFCNRKNELKELKTAIENNYSTWLFAPRRYGKSSLVKKVFSEVEDVKTIYLDLYNIKSVDDFSRKYSNLLSKELFNWKNDIKEISKSAVKYFKNLSPNITFDENGNPGINLLSASIKEQKEIETILNVPEKIAQEQGIKICIAFDEFQEIDRIDKFMINWMRSAFQNQKNVCYVFLGSKQSLMQNIFTSINSPFYEYAIKMDIEAIKREELFNFIQQKFKNQDVKIAEALINNILDKSKCHPHYTQYFASVVFNVLVAENTTNITEEWFDRIINAQSDIFQNIYDQLNNNQRLLLNVIANEEQEIYSKENREKYSLPSTASMSVSINALIKKDLVNKQKGKYLINNLIFKEWILKIN